MALIFRSLATSGFVGGKERTADLAELMETSRSLALSGGEIRWAVNTSLMNELTKIQVAQRLKAWDWPSITLGQQLTVSDALHDVSIFALDGGPQLTIQVNTAASVTDQKSLAELLQAGAAKSACTLQSQRYC